MYTFAEMYAYKKIWKMNFEFKCVIRDFLFAPFVLNIM